MISLVFRNSIHGNENNKSRVFCGSESNAQVNLHAKIVVFIKFVAMLLYKPINEVKYR